MNDNFDPESKSALIRYRLERSSETLAEAKVLSDNGFYNAAVNRLYYACYYAAVALLLIKGLSTQTHHGVKTLLGCHFISTGQISSNSGKAFTTLFEKRHSTDYDDFVCCDKEMVDDLVPRAETFIAEVRSLIAKSGENV